MTLKREPLLKGIIDKLLLLQKEISIKSGLNLNDLAVIAEDFIKDLLNIVFDFNLKNLNSSRANYPGIDLGDETNKVAVQVTCTASTQKIEDTIDTFRKHDFHKKYNHLYIFALKSKSKNYPSLRTFDFFDPRNDVLDFNTLFKSKISDLPTQKLKEIYDFCNQEIQHSSVYGINIDFQPYLQAILANDDYREWQTVYTRTTVESRQPIPEQQAGITSQRRFSSPLKLRVEDINSDNPGKSNQFNDIKRQEHGEQWEVLAGLRHYAVGHLVLIGKPGSGKSTSLERLLWEEAEKALQDPNTRIPVLVKLRRCTGSVEGLIRDFLLGHQVALEIVQIEKLLCQGRFLLLLDGLNELPKTFETEVANFRDRYRATTPMIVSTRDLGGGGTLGIKKTLQMLPLTEPQMREFVRGYLGEEGDRLFEQLQGDRLEKFAETPLLLWMLCRVFAHSGTVPNNLGLAFREFAQLHDRELQADAPADSKDQWHKLLRHLAFVMMQGKTVIDPQLSIPREEAEDCLTAYLQQVGWSNPREYAERWLKDLLKYHLIQPVVQPNLEEHIEFCHQLIQEYYAAEYLLRLLPNLTDEKLKQDYLNYVKWTEPLSITLSLINDQDLIAHLINLSVEIHLNLTVKLIKASRSEHLISVFQKLNEKINSIPVRFWLIGKTNYANGYPILEEILIQEDNRFSDFAALGLLQSDRNQISEKTRKVLEDKKLIRVIKISDSTTPVETSNILLMEKKREQSMSAREKIFDFYFGGDYLVAYMIEKLWSACNEFSIVTVLKVLFEMWNNPYSIKYFEDFMSLIKEIKLEHEYDIYGEIFEFMKDKNRHEKSAFATFTKLLEMQLEKSINFSVTFLFFYIAVSPETHEFLDLTDNKGLYELMSLKFMKSLIEENALYNGRFFRYMLEILEYLQLKYQFYNYEIYQAHLVAQQADRQES